MRKQISQTREINKLSLGEYIGITNRLTTQGGSYYIAHIFVSYLLGRNLHTTWTSDIKSKHETTPFTPTSNTHAPTQTQHRKRKKKRKK